MIREGLCAPFKEDVILLFSETCTRLSADELASLLGQQEDGHEGFVSGRGTLSLFSSRPRLGVLPARFSAGVSWMYLQTSGPE